MKKFPRRQQALTLGLGLFVAGLGGCQTYVPGTSQTLPSPFYLQHPPQFIPPSPQFPLPRELAHLEDASGQAAAAPPGPAVVVPAPAAVPVPPPAAVPAPPPPGAAAPGPQMQ